MKKLLIAFLSLIMASSLAYGYNESPGKGVTVNPARATWNTGYFQEAIVRKGLEELGYNVKRPKDLQNPIFYQALTQGDIDYWTNGWFPLHNNQLPKNFKAKADTYGYIAKAGGMQGYLVSKKHVEQYNIKTLEDFKRPEVQKAFDKNGNGKADLIACPPGWGCEKVISHHMDVYNLKDYIHPIQAAYAASIAEGLAQYNDGQPVFLYTWAPNWTVFKFMPGKDVMWIGVPGIKPTSGQESSVDKMTVSGIEGAVSDPIELGFVVNDIRIVANKSFTKKNPAAKTFFELVKIPLADINEQNTKMQDGEDSQRDVERHASDWIEKNKDLWNGWLCQAKAAVK